ncbi:ER degradation-enhancing alpha-mannosidase-like protein 3 [Tyrophagus putrescentiae]|nr:ER degradation-enhancing alpha-mannosidase-like protein 3 [Tyrophagus putrescentiae]
MHRPHSQAKNFMDSLLAFWPGLQVLKGDLRPAIETHEVLYQVTQRHTFLPEAFTVDRFNVHWPHHPLRPEFIESTYFLYQATGDEHYLQVGKEALSSLQNYTRVPCGFAAVNDVRTKKKEDRMDSFFLAETLKYLYLLFSKKGEIAKQQQHHQHLMDSSGYYKLIRKGVEDFASRPSSTSSTTSSSSSSSHRLRHPSLLSVPRLRAADFSAAKPEHIELLKGLGISVLVLKDGRVQLVHNSAAAWSMDDAEEGALFMQEMIALSKMQVAEETRLRMVSFTLKSRAGSESDSGSSSSSPPPNNEVNISLLGGPAQFGLDLAALEQPVSGELVRAEPAIDACQLEEIGNRAEMAGRVVLAQRGGCMFIEKARNVQRLGALGIIIADNAEGSSSKTMPMFAMSGDGSTDVVIPAVFLYTADAKILFGALEESTASGSPLVLPRRTLRLLAEPGVVRVGTRPSSSCSRSTMGNQGCWQRVKMSMRFFSSGSSISAMRSFSSSVQRRATSSSRRYSRIICRSYITSLPSWRSKG